MKMKHFILVFVSLLICLPVMAQQKTITGTITSASDRSGLIGAAVMIKGTTSGTITDFDGHYSIISKTPQCTLVFSSLGFKTTEVIVKPNQQVVDLVMEENVNALADVVVIGYGSTKKALLTGANLNVKGDDLAKLNTGTALEALQGVAAGVSISRNNGSPGAGTKVTIRGMGTINNSSPLYVVDGVTVSSIDYLSPSDIESIDVLKDAASAAIYGSRAANGVILVTTKKGTIDSKPRISYDAYVGWQNIYKKPDMLNAQEYMSIVDEGRSNQGLEPRDWETMLSTNSYLNSQVPGLAQKYGEDIWNNLQDGWEGTDWLDAITDKDATIQSHAVSIIGGSQDVAYSLGVSYLDQKSIIGGDISDAGYKRLSSHINTTMTLIKKGKLDILKIGENITYTHTKRKIVATGNMYWNDVHSALVQNPLSPVFWDQSPDGNNYAPTLDNINMEHMNPVAKIYYQRNFSWGEGNNIIGNVFAELQPIKNLVFRSSFGIDAWFGNDRSYNPIYNLGIRSENTVDNVSMNANQGANRTWTNTVDYKHQFGEHSVEVLLGTEFHETSLNLNLGGSNKRSTFGDAEHAYLSNVKKEEIADISLYGADYAAQGGGLMSYMSRISYNYKGIYMFDTTMRADGSSNFAKGHRWGYFPSVSAGWNFTEEKFMKDNKIFDYGKLRASWGQNGNQSIPNFIYSSNIAYSSEGYYFGENKTISSTTAYPANVPNEDVSWETSEQLNFGLDARFLDSRLSLAFDWYKKTTKDWLVLAPIQGTAGAGAPYINGGDIENKGYEIVLGWNDHIGEFNYGAKFNLFHNKNTVTKINNAEKVILGTTNVLAQGSSYVSRVEVGHAIGSFYGFQTDGILQNQQEVDAYVGPEGNPYFEDQRPGDIRFVDRNNDGVINDNDKTFIGDPNPDFELGFQLNAEYKGFYGAMTLTGKTGMQVMNNYFWGDPRGHNFTTDIFDRWHGEGTSTRIPRLSSVSDRNTMYMSEAYIYDADFVRISNLTIGYDFKKYVDKVPYLTAAKLYCSVSNLYTFTNYKGFDPDVSYGGETSWASGIDLGLYPLPRTVMVGVNLTF